MSSCEGSRGQNVRPGEGNGQYHYCFSQILGPQRQAEESRPQSTDQQRDEQFHKGKDWDLKCKCQHVYLINFKALQSATMGSLPLHYFALLHYSSQYFQ